jgi:DNA-binding NarL/FixJ family response regulator
MDDIRVCLIEDHDLTRVGLRTALQQQKGVQVVGEAPNAMQGLRLLDSQRPDVAIVDIGLPDKDGIELTRRFKRSLQESGDRDSTKVLILTMHDNEDSILAAFAAGADSYCMKDASIDKLTEALQSTYHGNSWIDPAIASVVLKQVRHSMPHGQDTEEAKRTSINAVEPEYEKLLENSPLTERELEVLELIVAGNSNDSIAQKLYITVGTVKTHVRNILNKLSADDRTQAAVRALRAGLVS